MQSSSTGLLKYEIQKNIKQVKTSNYVRPIVGNTKFRWFILYCRLHMTIPGTIQYNSLYFSMILDLFTNSNKILYFYSIYCDCAFYFFWVNELPLFSVHIRGNLTVSFHKDNEKYTFFRIFISENMYYAYHIPIIIML